jgi:hypothetical protein
MRAQVTILMAALGLSACALVGFDLDGYGPAGKGGGGGQGLDASTGTRAQGAGGSGASGGGAGTGGVCADCCGDGTVDPGSVCFGPYIPKTVGLGPKGLALGDLDGDGRLDIAVTLPQANALSVLRNFGNHGYEMFRAFGTGVGPTQVVLGALDVFNPLPDVATADPGGFSVLRNASVTGNVAFDDAVSGVVAGAAHLVALISANSDADAYPDLAVVEVAGGRVNFFESDGMASFAGVVTFVLGAGTQFTGVAAADLDDDGREDLVVLDYASASVFIMQQISDLNFSVSQLPVGAGLGARALILADLDGDGLPDLLVGSDDGTLSVLMNEGQGDFSARAPVNASAAVASLATADFDGDGSLDVAASDATQGSVTILLGDGNGGFTVGPVLDGLFPGEIAAGDLDGDGAPDLVVVEASDNRVTIVPSNP